MNIFQLVLKQMRQRALGTWLTLLSVTLGVSLAVAVMLVERESGRLFGQSDYGYDVLIGPKSSKLNLVLNTAYHLGDAAGTIPYAYYEQFPRNLPQQFQQPVAWKVPIAVGDQWEGHRIVGTIPKMFGFNDDGKELPPDRTPAVRRDMPFKFAQGRVFHAAKFEAIIGSDIAEKGLLKLGSKFQAQHGGIPGEEHAEQWEVVGILQPTNTANDRVLFIPLISYYAIPEHEEALTDIGNLNAKPGEPAEHEEHDHEHDHAYHLNDDGTIELHVPKEDWRISAMMVRSRMTGMQLMWAVNNGADAMAVSPAVEMRSFFDTFLKGITRVLLMLAILVSVVASISILVSIYNSVSARLREIAILRALGATRAKILTLICLEAGLIGLFGSIFGMLLAHAMAGVGSVYFENFVGQGLDWITISRYEWLYLLGVAVLAVLAGLVPALKAYRTPVASNLVAV